jgi:hypothetical protein
MSLYNAERRYEIVISPEPTMDRFKQFRYDISSWDGFDVAENGVSYYINASRVTTGYSSTMSMAITEAKYAIDRLMDPDNYSRFDYPDSNGLEQVQDPTFNAYDGE